VFVITRTVSALALLGLAPFLWALTAEQARQFHHPDYILGDGIVIEYRGADKELYFVDHGKPYHYSRVIQESDGDLFRWVYLNGTEQEKYIRYLATPRDPLPEVIIREGIVILDDGKTVPDTICRLIHDGTSDKPRNVYLVDMETGTFDPVLEEAVRELREELGGSITKGQAILVFHERCSSESYPVEQMEAETGVFPGDPAGKTMPASELKQAKVAAPGTETPTGNIATEVPAESEQVAVAACGEINDDIYRITDSTTRAERLSSFISQLEYVDSWDWGAPSYEKLISLINIAYPVYLHYAYLDDDQKERYTGVIARTYNAPARLFRRLPCRKRNQINIVFEKVLGKTR